MNFTTIFVDTIFMKNTQQNYHINIKKNIKYNNENIVFFCCEQIVTNYLYY